MRIVFFSRCDLVHLYGSLHKELSKKHDIIHLAYSDVEEKILREKYKIANILNFKKDIEKLNYDIDLSAFDYLELDGDIIKYTKGRFCLNSVIASDRTFEYQQYENTLKLSAIYSIYWKGFYEKNNVDVIYHEPTSLVINHMASIYSKKFGCRYLTSILTHGPYQNNFIYLSGDDAYFDEFNSDVDMEYQGNVDEFISKFKHDFSTLANELSKKTSLVEIINIFFRSSLRKIRLKKDFSDTDHIEEFLYKSINPIRTLYNSICEKYIVKYASIKDEDEFYYYPLHLEPEAVVLYWGDGIYKNQVKLIENIASQLPPKIYLYVKDHPHGGGYRDYMDYKKIQAIPNVKLINNKENGKKLISRSKGVITINGTSGFEAILLNKPAIIFGHAWYSSFNGVSYVKNIKELHDIINDINDNFSIKEDITKFLSCVHSGFVNYFGDLCEKSGVNHEDNIKKVSLSIDKYINRVYVDKK